MILIQNTTFNRIMGMCSLGFHFLYVGKTDNHLIILTVQIAGLLQTNYVWTLDIFQSYHHAFCMDLSNDAVSDVVTKPEDEQWLKTSN